MSVIGLVALSWLWGAVPAALAQGYGYFRGGAGVNRENWRSGVGIPGYGGRQLGAFRRGQLSGLAAGGYGGYPGYYGSYESPIGGYLSGAADIINAQGNWMISSMQARQIGEQVKQAKIDTRRKTFDEYLYERENTPTFEDEREHFRLEEIRRSRNDPPLAEIYSGEALNSLLTAIQQVEGRAAPGPNMPIDDDVIKHLNVTSGSASGSAAGGIGLLKEGGRLNWPLVLRKSAFEADRQHLNELAPVAYKQAADGGQVDGDTLQGMIDCVRNLNTEVSANIGQLTPNDYSAAKRYLRDLEGTIKTLQDPNAGNYVTRKWAPTGASVAEVITDLTRKGLRFAPASSGDEAAYVAMHRGLANYYAGPQATRSYEAMPNKGTE
jgi:hypothetical protein